MNIFLAIASAFTALWKGLGLIAQSLYFKRAKQAGHTEAELAITEKAVENIKVRHETEDRNRTATADELERLLD